MDKHNNNDNTIPSQLPTMTIPSTLGPASGYASGRSQPAGGLSGLSKLLLLAALVALVVYLTN